MVIGKACQTSVRHRVARFIAVAARYLIVMGGVGRLFAAGCHFQPHSGCKNAISTAAWGRGNCIPRAVSVLIVR